MLISPFVNMLYRFSKIFYTTRANNFVNNATEMLYLLFIIEKGLYLADIPNNAKSDFATGKSLSCDLLIKCLLNISFLNAKGN